MDEEKKYEILSEIAELDLNKLEINHKSEDFKVELEKLKVWQEVFHKIKDLSSEESSNLVEILKSKNEPDLNEVMLALKKI